MDGLVTMGLVCLRKSWETYLVLNEEQLQEND